MKNYLFKFKWQVHVDGYQVKNLSIPSVQMKHFKDGEIVRFREVETWEEKPVIVPISDAVREYYPFEDYSDLGRKFANLSSNSEKSAKEEQVIGFVNEYGVLGVGQFYGEPMESFEDLACKYQELYSLIDTNKADAIALFNQDIFSSVKLTIERKDDSAKKSFKFVPENLAGVIAIQAAEEIIGGQSLVSCENPRCKNWFVRRANKRVCSTKCRVAINRLKN